jgi:O-acetyl-ADP-ribose deacetylase (regulator of RNase III)
MIKAIVGSIFDNIEPYGIDGIMNAANSLGNVMGRGIAGEIRCRGGQEIVDDAYETCALKSYNAGEAYASISGRLLGRGVKRIIHAITMKNPGGYTDYKIVNSAFKSAIKLAEAEGITCLGCTALGTGVGKLDPILVANEMADALIDSKTTISVVFCDFNKEFIDEIKKCLRLE